MSGGADGDDAPQKIPNPYLAAIKSAKTSSTQPADELKEALKSVTSAMNGNCWQSSIADDFFHALSHHESTLAKCRTNTMDTFDDAIAEQPEMVDPNSWQAHWHNLGR